MENGSKKSFFNKRSIIIFSIIAFVLIAVLLIIYIFNKNKAQDGNKVFHCNYGIPIAKSMIAEIDMYLYIEDNLVTKQVSLASYKFDMNLIDSETVKSIKDELYKTIKEKESEYEGLHYDITEGEDYIEFGQTLNIAVDSDFNTDFDNKIKDIIEGTKNVGGNCKYE